MNPILINFIELSVYIIINFLYVYSLRSLKIISNKLNIIYIVILSLLIITSEQLSNYTLIQIIKMTNDGSVYRFVIECAFVPFLILTLFLNHIFKVKFKLKIYNYPFILICYVLNECIFIEIMEYIAK